MKPIILPQINKLVESSGRRCRSEFLWKTYLGLGVWERIFLFKDFIYISLNETDEANSYRNRST